MSEEPDFYTVKELEEILSVSRTTLYDWRQEGIGPPWIKVSGTIRYPKSGFQEWLEEETDRQRSA
jgi:predicted DNA-binding transcriptional regulator AlpA